MQYAKSFFPSILCIVVLALTFQSCGDDEDSTGMEDMGMVDSDDYPAVSRTFGNSINLNNLENYANQAIPNYIDKDNTAGNPITDRGATLGRILFYDKQLSLNNTISCASCHIQANGFSDTRQASVGVAGNTGRHSMRLINARFADEERFFWDERANSLEDQTTRPIQDHIEMGFSGTEGDPDFGDLIVKLEAIDYYQELFTFVYGDAKITEARIQQTLAQFIRSIQSFDSKYDVGRANANNNNQAFTNFTNQENQGKALFATPPQLDNNGMRIGGGIGCNNCHRAPEFDISPNSRNNGLIASLGGGTDLTNTRAPSLRDLVRPDGTLNGPMMHTGSINSIAGVLEHYNLNIQQNNNLDNRLRENGNPQRLNMTDAEKAAVAAFLLTLTGDAVYTDAKWSDPFL